MIPHRLLVIAFGVGCLTGTLSVWFFRASGNRGEVEQPTAEVALAEPFALPGEQLVEKPAEREDGLKNLLKLSGDWISGDGEQKAKLDYRILSFEDTPDWPDLQKQDFLLGTELQFLSDTGFYTMSGEEDTITFIKEDRKTKSLSRLTLYRMGSPFAAARPPLPRTPPPPSIQALLDLVPTIRESESLEAVFSRFPKDWTGKLTVIGGDSGMGESDIFFDLEVNGEWMLHAKKKLRGDKILRFRLVRSYMQDRNGKGPDVRRVVFPYYEFGKIITGPMEAKDAAQ
jgi:hypothetical protein